MPSCSAWLKACGIITPANLLRACGGSADVGLNEQKDHAEGKPRFSVLG
ncbi:hypothetical protein [Klebsiella pneumoniae IS39]|nr:hypothetical protein [Klebsiella pneumoniae IS39]